LLAQPLIEFGKPFHDTQRGANRPRGMVRIGLRGAEERHHAITDELLDHAALGFNGGDDLGEE